jgi:hypothetical protein
MANTPQPYAGNCRYASSPYRLPCREQGTIGNWFRLTAIPPLGGTASRSTTSARPSFSNAWNIFFQHLEHRADFSFPTLGTISSNLWKI